MRTVCVPTNYDTVSVSVSRQRPGNYTLYEAHRHEGENSYCPLQDQYTDLTWHELVDLILAVLEGRRPGMHPAGWEQVQLDLDV